MISAEQFLKILVEKDLLSSRAVEKLLKQVEEASKPVSARRVAKRLVEKGYLTPALAKRLLLTADEETEAPEKPRPEKPRAVRRAEPEEEELGLAPTEEEQEKQRQKAATIEDDLAALEPVRGETEALDPIPGESAIFGFSAPPPAPAAPKATFAPPAPRTPVAPEAPAAPAGPNPPPVPPPRPSSDVVSGEVVSGEIVSDAPAARRAVDDAEESPFGPGKRKSGLMALFRRIVPERDRTRKENVWDSSLLLVGGGVLLLLVLLLVALVWWYLRESGDTVLKNADQLYADQSYTKAIDQYTQYIERYASGDEKASRARVFRGMARLRKSTQESGRSYVNPLKIAQEVLTEIRSEEAFPDAKAELKGILPTIAEGWARQAQAETGTELVGKAREAIDLIEIYIPSQQRNKVQMEEITSILALTEREIARDDELAKALAGIEEATARQKADQAYAIRKTLLKTYPDLATNAKLSEAIHKVSAAQRDVVRMVAEPKSAETSPPAGPATTTVTLAQQILNTEVSAAQGQVVYALAEGAAYGLDAATGRVLWRRFVGLDTDGASLPYPPTSLGAQFESDALMVDAAARALVRVEATTGRPRWLLAVGEPFTANPVVDGSRILMATPSGRLLIVEIESGNSPGYIQVPQPLRVAPTVDAQRGRLYQVADHSNLYVLARDGRCEEVVYLAHESGNIVTPPVILSNFLVVAENQGLDTAVLRVFTLEPSQGKNEKEAKPAFREIQRLSVEGRIDTPPLAAGSRLLVTTDRGRVIAYDLSGTNVQAPLEMITQQQPSERKDVVRFPLLVRHQFWIADDHLTKYIIQASTADFRTQWVACKDSAFSQPMVALEQAVYVVRRRLGLPGVVVTAMAMDKPSVLWETTLAAPLAAEPNVDPQTGRVEAITAAGSVLDVPIAEMKGSAVADKAVVSLDAATDGGLVVRDALHMSDGLLALFAGPGSDKLAVFDPQVAPKRLRNVALPGPIAAAPAAMGGGLLVPSAAGQILLIQPRTGGAIAEPFQPRLTPGQKIAWRRPAVSPEGQWAVVSDGQTRLYRLGLRDQPRAHLASLDEVETEQPIVSDVAIVGQTAYAVDAEGNLRSFALPKLAPGPSVALSAQAAWGPRRVGAVGFLAPDDEQLLCLDGQGKVTWKVALLYGPLAGTPLVVGDQVLLTSVNGTLWRVELVSGKETAKLDTRLSLAAGPVLVGNQVLLTGGDGTLYLVGQP